jgi:hypothetical protein
MNREKLRRSKIQRHWRELAFEQVESRFALSATSAIDVTEIDFQWDRDSFLTAWQGGFINLGQQGSPSPYVFNSSGLTAYDTTYGRVMFGYLRDELKLDSTSDFDLSVSDAGITNSHPQSMTTIQQPTMGPMRPDGGTIAIDEIFAVAPLVKMGAETHQVVRSQFERVETHPESTERLSLSRARDVYFEVASRVENDEFESQDHLAASDNATVEEQLAADEETNEKSESASIATLVARGRSLPAAQDALASEPVQIRGVAKPLREAPSMTQSPESENKTENATRPKQVSQTEVRDQVFQVWRDSKLDAMKRSPGRPEEEEQDDTASWPVLAALAVGGLVFSSRWLNNPASIQQLPPRKKHLDFSRLES